MVGQPRVYMASFRLPHLSQACAMRACELMPTLMTFMGSMPGMIAVVVVAAAWYKDELGKRGKQGWKLAVLE